MKISILTPNLAGNSLGRAYILARVLARHYDVEIIGPCFGSRVWPPLAENRDVPFSYVNITRDFQSYRRLREEFKLSRRIDGDVVYASKPLFASFGLALVDKIRRDKPLVLDIDDWELGFVKDRFHRLRWYQKARFLLTATGWNHVIFDKLHCAADALTVSNTFLRQKYGGRIVWHGRDTDFLNPANYDAGALRKHYGISEKDKVVVFYGTPRPHKGVTDLIKAMRLVGRGDARLLVIGLDKEKEYSRNVEALGAKVLGERFMGLGMQPFSTVGEFLSMTDVVVIPQRRSTASIGQTPAKVFDAMAMAKPVVATRVNDLAEILDGCGIIVEPQAVEELASAIISLLDNPQQAREIGRKAREKCIEKYSWDAMERTLIEIFKDFE